MKCSFGCLNPAHHTPHACHTYRPILCHTLCTNRWHRHGPVGQGDGPNLCRKERVDSNLTISALIGLSEHHVTDPRAPTGRSVGPRRCLGADFIYHLSHGQIMYQIMVRFTGVKTPQQQPGSYQGGEMMMKSVFWWRKPEYPEETTDLRQVTDETIM